MTFVQAQFYSGLISHHVIIPLLSGGISQQMHDKNGHSLMGTSMYISIFSSHV